VIGQSPKPAEPAEPGRQPTAVLFAYAMAWAGGCVAYMPFLTLLLPIRFTELAGTADLHWLGLTAVVGALAASIGNIAWGWASDRAAARGGDRRRWAATGLVLIALTSAAMAWASTPLMLIAFVALWQLALNLFLAPLAAFAADSVPARQQGMLGGMLAFGPGVAAVSVVVVLAAPPGLPSQLALILAITAAAALPLLLIRRVAPLGRMARSPPSKHGAGNRRVLVQLWAARLTVQVAEGLIFVFLYYFLRDLSGGTLDVGRYALANAAVQLCSIPVALAVGRFADRSGRRRAPLLAMIVLIAIGLTGMAVAHAWTPVILAYGLFLIGSNSFLALHSAFAMQQLADPRHFGRDLGLFNLTNTIPAVTTPLLAILVIGAAGYSGLLLTLAAFMALPALLVFRLDIP